MFVNLNVFFCNLSSRLFYHLVVWCFLFLLHFAQSWQYNIEPDGCQYGYGTLSKTTWPVSLSAFTFYGLGLQIERAARHAVLFLPPFLLASICMLYSFMIKWIMVTREYLISDQVRASFVSPSLISHLQDRWAITFSFLYLEVFKAIVYCSYPQTLALIPNFCNKFCIQRHLSSPTKAFPVSILGTRLQNSQGAMCTLCGDIFTRIHTRTLIKTERIWIVLLLLGVHLEQQHRLSPPKPLQIKNYLTETILGH